MRNLVWYECNDYSFSLPEAVLDFLFSVPMYCSSVGHMHVIYTIVSMVEQIQRTCRAILPNMDYAYCDVAKPALGSNPLSYRNVQMDVNDPYH